MIRNMPRGRAKLETAFHKEIVSILMSEGFREIERMPHNHPYDYSAVKNGTKYGVEVKAKLSGYVFSIYPKQYVKLKALQKEMPILILGLSKVGHVLVPLSEVKQNPDSPIYKVRIEQIPKRNYSIALHGESIDIMDKLSKKFGGYSATCEKALKFLEDNLKTDKKVKK